MSKGERQKEIEEFNRSVEIRNAIWAARFEAMKTGHDVMINEAGKLIKFRMSDGMICDEVVL